MSTAAQTVASQACHPEPQSGSVPDPMHQSVAGPRPNGNRRGNPNLGSAPRCGARTRAGCCCRAPAIHGKLRCRMHGGRSTGPRSEDGMARLRAARTRHGGYSAEARALNRHILTMLRRARVGNDAIRYEAHLPPDLAARLSCLPAELLPPPFPAGGLSPAEDRAVLRAEAAALAPWKQAIALARAAGRRAAASPTGSDGTGARSMAEAHAPEPAVGLTGTPAGDAGVEAGAHVPEPAVDLASTTADGDAGVQAEAHAPAPAVGLTGTPAGDAGVQAEAHAPAQADKPFDPGAAGGSSAGAEAHAPVQSPARQRWNGIRRCPPPPQPDWAALPGFDLVRDPGTGLRRQLLASTRYTTSAMLVDGVGGWSLVADAVIALKADAAPGRDRGAKPRTGEEQALPVVHPGQVRTLGHQDKAPGGKADARPPFA